MGLLVVIAMSVALIGRDMRAGPDRAVGAVAGRLFLNLGALELNKALGFAPLRPADRGQHASAADALLQRSLALAPDDPAVYLNLAQLAIARTDLVGARRLISEARQRAAPGDSLFLFQVGRLYRETGSVDLAISAWRGVDRTTGAWSCSSTDTQFLRWGLDLLERQRWVSAAKVFQAAIEVTPTEPRAYELLTTATLGEDAEVEEAVAVMEKLARAWPDIPWPFLEVAKLHDQAGRLDDVRRWNQRAEALRNSRAWVELRRQYQPVRECAEYLAPRAGRIT
jgi:tetratricopeptide (TPR) repeat protein